MTKLIMMATPETADLCIGVADKMLAPLRIIDEMGKMGGVLLNDPLNLSSTQVSKSVISRQFDDGLVAFVRDGEFRDLEEFWKAVEKEEQST